MRRGNQRNVKISIVGGDFVKRRIFGAFVALLWLISALSAGAADEGKIFQGHIVDSSLKEEESEIIPGYILDGPTAEDGGASAKPGPAAQFFTVTFAPNGDGASVSPATKRVMKGRAYGELPTPTRDGYVFDYWRTASGEKISANRVFDFNANQTLYAEWRLPTCEVRFDPNGGSVRELAIDVLLGGDYGELPQPVRPGYRFLGWYTQAQGGERVFSHAALTRTENHTLYAHWLALPAQTEPEEAPAVFQDVPTTSSYYPAVYWAVQKGITSGTSPETFSPNDPCKRRHILTFLWRANGCPEPVGTLGGSPSGTTNASDGIWTKGAIWAYEHTLIPAPFSYNAEESSTRSDAVTYLWKLAGCPMEESLQSIVERFTDVSPESDYAPAVAWALDAGITNGTTETTFSPERICTRGQIVTFLYRCYTR